MAILLNELLFFTALLFQMQSPVLAEEALLELNFKKQSFKMEFVHLQYPEKAEAQAQEFVARLESKLPFHHEELGLKIEKIKLKKIRGQALLRIQGHFEDKERLLQALQFEIDENQHIFYTALSEERVLNSNKGARCEWTPKDRKLFLHLGRRLEQSWENEIEEQMGPLKGLEQLY